MIKSEHIEWVRLLPKPKYPLMISGIRSLSTKELIEMGFKFERIPLFGSLPRDAYGPKTWISALAKHYNVQFGNVTLCAGANMAIYLLCAGLLNHGDEIILESPSYEPFRCASESRGAKIKYLHRRLANHYQPDPDELKKLITKRTKVILISNLHNPSGVKLENNTVKALINVAEKHGVYIACDEVYHDFLWDKRDETFCKHSPMAISLSSLTKVYGLGLMRAGWIMANPKLTYLFSRTYDYMPGNDSYPAQMIALYCLRNINKLISRTKIIEGKSLSIIKNWMATESRLQWVEPDGGIVCFLRLPQGVNSRKFQQHLLKKYDTAVVPGDFFGTPGYIRVAGGIKASILQKGLKNISAALDDFKL